MQKKRECDMDMDMSKSEMKQRNNMQFKTIGSA